MDTNVKKVNILLITCAILLICGGTALLVKAVHTQLYSAYPENPYGSIGYSFCALLCFGSAFVLVMNRVEQNPSAR